MIRIQLAAIIKSGAGEIIFEVSFLNKHKKNMEDPYLNLFLSLIISDLPILDTLSVIPHTPLYTVLNYI